MQRNIQYDLMRLVGIFVIMIAHAHPPDWIFQLRNFGTPLLIVGSGLTYAYIYRHTSFRSRAFFKKRLPKLLVPAWLFMLLFFPLSYAILSMAGIAYPFTEKEVLASFVFTGGMPFIWIFKIYFVLALLTPIALKLNHSIHSTKQLVGLLALVISLHQLVIVLLGNTIEQDGLFSRTLLTFIPYGVIYCYAFRLEQFTNRQLLMGALVTGGVAASLFANLLLSGATNLDTQAFKYPPRLYYLSYALFCIHLIFFMVRWVSPRIRRTQQAILWISNNSLWIYLWHIPFTYLVTFTLENPNFYEQFFIIIAGGMSVTALQNKLLSAPVISTSKWARPILPFLVPNQRSRHR